MTWSYSARLVVEHLRTVGGVTFAPHSSRMGGFSFCETGLRVSFDALADAAKDCSVTVSVQTAPAVAREAFAETALMSETGFLDNGELGYGDRCLSHGTPEELFEHLGALKAAIEGAVEAKDTAFFDRLFGRDAAHSP